MFFVFFDVNIWSLNPAVPPAHAVHLLSLQGVRPTQVSPIL